MRTQAGQLGHDAGAIFAYVRSLGYESYAGSLRGTRGTLWSEAGNSVDHASLLIAMLRASGVPARYRHGTLSTTDAKTLIDSMFPARTRTVGQVPAGASTVTETVAPGVTTTHEVVLSPALDIYDLATEVVAVGADVAIGHARATAAARLTVVDRFVQVTSVT